MLAANQTIKKSGFYAAQLWPTRLQLSFFDVKRSVDLFVYKRNPHKIYFFQRWLWLIHDYLYTFSCVYGILHALYYGRVVYSFKANKKYIAYANPYTAVLHNEEWTYTPYNPEVEELTCTECKMVRLRHKNYF